MVYSGFLFKNNQAVFRIHILFWSLNVVVFYISYNTTEERHGNFDSGRKFLFFSPFIAALRISTSGRKGCRLSSRFRAHRGADLKLKQVVSLQLLTSGIWISLV